MTEAGKVKHIKRADKMETRRATITPEEQKRELMRAYRRYVRLSEDVKQELREKFGIRL
jgi:hypothetical protein